MKYNIPSGTLRKIILFSAMLLCTLSSFASVDMLKQLKQYDESKGNKQINIANQIFDFLFKEEMLDIPWKVSSATDHDSIDMYVWFHGADYLYSTGDYQNALTYAEKALPFCLTHQSETYDSDCYNLIAISCLRLSLYSQSLDASRHGLAIDEKRGDKEYISSSLNTIAGICLASKRSKEGEQYIMRAVKLAKETGNKKRLAITSGMASEIYTQLNDQKKALAYAQKAYKLEQELGNKERAAVRECEIANVLISMKRYSEAKGYLQKSIPVLKAAGNDHSLALCYFAMGEILNQQKQHTEAIKYLSQSLKIFKQQSDLNHCANAYHGLWQALKDTDAKTAGDYLSKYADLKDSIYQQDVANMLTDFDSFYRNDKLTQENEELKLQRNNMSWIALVVSIAAVLVIMSLLYALRQRKKATKMMRDTTLARERFFTNITHEFRTPLTVILGEGGRMADADLVDPKRQQLAGNMIVRQGRNLMNLVNQLLDISKLKSGIGDPEWRSCDIVPLIQMIVEGFDCLAEDKHLKLVFSPHEKSIIMDVVPDYIQKLIRNLIANAVKFTGTNGKVIITCNVYNEHFVLQVADSGKGMSRETIEHIFQPFYQGDDDNKNIGTGVGLSLVKQIVDMMNGNIKVESFPGKGSIFTVRLPLKQGDKIWKNFDVSKLLIDPEMFAMKPHEQTSTSKSDKKKERILVVEDNGDVALYIGSQLQDYFQVEYASNGLEGLQKAIDTKPSLILTDVMMPEMDGIEMCRKLRCNDETNTIPIIMITAKTSQESLEEGLMAGANAYLTKPFRRSELLVRINQILAERRLLQEKFALAKTEVEEAGEEILGEDKEFISNFTNIIYDQMRDGEINLEVVGKKMYISERQLRRKISDLTGMTPRSYVVKIKIDYARQLLKTKPELSATEVSYRCGFSDLAQFSRAFKSQTGMSPVQFRKAL